MTRRLQLVVRPDEHKKLADYARQRNTTISELMRRYIRNLLEQKGN
jgi:hypothetical protein